MSSRHGAMHWAIGTQAPIHCATVGMQGTGGKHLTWRSLCRWGVRTVIVSGARIGGGSFGASCVGGDTYDQTGGGTSDGAGGPSNGGGTYDNTVGGTSDGAGWSDGAGCRQ